VATCKVRRCRTRPYWVVNAIYIHSGNLGLARALARRPEVATILPESVYTIPPLTTEAGCLDGSLQWNVTKIRADTVWEYHERVRESW